MGFDRLLKIVTIVLLVAVAYLLFTLIQAVDRTRSATLRLRAETAGAEAPRAGR